MADSSAFAGAVARLRLGQRHADDLVGEIRSWALANMDPESDLLTSTGWDDAEQAMVFEQPAKREVDVPAQWAEMFGTVLQDLRISLDRLAFALVGCGTTPDALESQKTNIQMPIVAIETRWARAARDRLPGVEGRPLEVVRSWQPFAQDGGKPMVLNEFREMVNADKHRAPRVVGFSQAMVMGHPIAPWLRNLDGFVPSGDVKVTADLGYGGLVPDQMIRTFVHGQRLHEHATAQMLPSPPQLITAATEFDLDMLDLLQLLFTLVGQLIIDARAAALT